MERGVQMCADMLRCFVCVSCIPEIQRLRTNSLCELTMIPVPWKWGAARKFRCYQPDDMVSSFMFCCFQVLLVDFISLVFESECGPSSSVGIATGYGLDGPGSNPGGGEIFCTCPDRPWGPPSLLYNGYRVFPGGKERPGRDADPSSRLVPWSWKVRAIPLLPIWAVRPVQSLSACTRVTFTLTFSPNLNFQ